MQRIDNNIFEKSSFRIDEFNKIAAGAFTEIDLEVPKNSIPTCLAKEKFLLQNYP